VIVEADSADSNLVTLEGFDLSEVTSNFTVAEILDNMELSDIHEYVTSKVEDGEMDS